MTAVADAPLWTPSEQRQHRSRLGQFINRRGFEDYGRLWDWSVAPATAGDFWTTVAAEFAVPWQRPPAASLEPDESRVAGARWFRGGQLNYAEAALANPAGGVVACSQTRPDSALNGADLRALVARVRTGLLERGVGPGDRVAGYLPNIPETLAALLATASLGAIWTCCAPEMGVAGVLDRLGQVEPVVFIACDGYRYGERRIDRRDAAGQISRGLPTLRDSIWLPYLDPDGDPPPGWGSWSALTEAEQPLEFHPCDFDHPLYILFSSGTTGKPKPIVHGHGGILLEHAKALGWHFDVGPGDRFFWFTTTGWMMWNFLVSGLVVGATVVTFDGEPSDLWGLMARQRVTCGGVGAGYLVAGEKAGDQPGQQHDLSALKTLGSTGSPLPASTAGWVYQRGLEDVMLGSFSGGTDVCTGFVGPSPLHPVWGGEISCRCLGAGVEVFDDDGRRVIGQEGELVLTAPLPSMPVGFWGDDGRRYRAAYFERFPGVWAHGDRATITDRDTVLISGRSDGTLNRGGVRMGTAEFYAVVEGLNEVNDSLVVHLGDSDELWLFVVPAPGVDANELSERIKAALRRDLSPRHVPDRIVMIESVPRTLSGKKLEVPVKRILSGVAPDDALTVASVADPESLEPFVKLAVRK
jgi:acetoacetyl-CoA synthetase